jgi:hypothetical protein
VLTDGVVVQAGAAGQLAHREGRLGIDQHAEERVARGIAERPGLLLEVRHRGPIPATPVRT